MRKVCLGTGWKGRKTRSENTALRLPQCGEPSRFFRDGLNFPSSAGVLRDATKETDPSKFARKGALRRKV